MREVFGISVNGHYVSDNLETAWQYSYKTASGGHDLHAADAHTEDGTLPGKCVVRYLAIMEYLLWQRTQGNRQYCMNP